MKSILATFALCALSLSAAPTRSMVAGRHISGSASPLPYDAEVEYLESEGHQCINTQVSVAGVSSLLSISCHIQFKDLNGGEHDIAGSGGVETPTMGRNGSQYFMWAQGGTSWYPSACDTDWHDVTFTFESGSGRTFTVDGTTSTSTLPNKFYAGDGLFIFAAGVGRYTLSCRMSQLQIRIDGALVRDFIPVRFTNENDVTEGAMYDKVSGQLFRNAGTGAFTIGPDKN